MPSSKKLILISGLAILAVALGLVYFLPKWAEAPGTENPSESATTTGQVDVSGGVQAITSTGEKIVGVDTSKLPPAPSLLRTVSYSSTLDASVRNIIAQKIKDEVTILKNTPYNLEAWIGLGLYYKQAGDYQAAKDAWEYSSLISPGNIVSFNNLGDLYHYYLKDYPKAEARFLSAIKNDKNYVLSYMNLFDLYRYSYKVDTTKAADILKQGISTNPGNLDLRVALAHYYAEKGDTANAKAYYKEAINKAKSIGENGLAATLQSELDGLK